MLHHAVEGPVLSGSRRQAVKREERRQAIMDLLFGLRDRHGATLVLVTHAPELAARCDRVAHLRDGLIERVEAGA